jgi:hypothetical protein
VTPKESIVASLPLNQAREPIVLRERHLPPNLWMRLFGHENEPVTNVTRVRWNY